MAQLGKAYIEVRADLAAFPADLRAKLEEAFREVGATAKFEELDKAAEEAGVEAADKLSDKMDEEVEKRSKNTGKKAGKGFFAGLGSVWSGLAAGFLPTLIAFAVQIGAYLLPAVGALAAAIPAAAAVAIGAIAPLIIAFHGVGDAIKAAFSGDPNKLAEALKKLAPAAQEFVKQINAARPALHAFQQSVQQAFFVQLNPGVREALKLLPLLRTYFNLFANDVGAFVRGALHTLFAQRGTLEEVLLGIHYVLADLQPLGSSLVRIFLTLAAVGLPFVDTLVRGLVGAVQAFDRFINTAAASGQLASFFQGALVILHNVGDFLGQILRLVGELGSALGGVGGGGLSVLTNVLRMINDFLATPAGSGMLAAVFTLLNTALQDLTNILTPLLPILGMLITDLAGGLTDALKVVAPLLQQIADFLGRHPQLVKDAIEAWGAYRLALMAVAAWEAIVDSLSPAGWLMIAVAAITAAAILIYTNWDKIKHATEQAWHAIEDVGKKIGHFFADIGRDIGGFFVDVGRWFEDLPGKIGDALAALPGIIGGAFEEAGRAAAYAVGFAIGWILKELVVLPGQVFDAIASIPGILKQVWDDATSWAIKETSALLDWLGDFFVKLPGRVQGWLYAFPGVLQGVFRDAWRVAKDTIISWGEDALSWISKLPNRIAGFFVNVGLSIVHGLRDALNAVIRQINHGIDDAAGPLKTFIPHIPYLAKGAIVDSPTMAMIGEAGREVVIPTNDPARAQELADKSGLTQMLSMGAPNVNVTVIAMLDTGALIPLVDQRVDTKLDDEAAALATGSKSGGF